MEQHLKSLKILHFAFSAGATMAYLFVGDILNIRAPKFEGEIMYYIFIPAIAVLASNFIFKNAISKIEAKKTISEKMSAYKTASIIRWAILEGAAFFILFVKPELVLFGVLLLLYLFLVKPTKEKIETELNIRL